MEVPTFDPGEEALDYLRREGYVVIRSVANASELALAKSLLWDFIEGAGVGAHRNDPSSWRLLRPNQYGIIWFYGVGQSKFMWFLRTRPRLLRAFTDFWGTEELLTSKSLQVCPHIEEATQKKPQLPGPRRSVLRWLR